MMTSADSTPSVVPPARRAPRVIEAAPASHGWARWLAGAPSLVALISSAIFVVIIAVRSSGHDLPWYEATAQEALARGDFKLSAICCQRLLVERPSDPGAGFGLAVSLQGLGRQEDAQQLLRVLAPLDSEGYPPAQLFAAEQLLKKPTSVERVRLAEAHVSQALRSAPDEPSAHALMATIYAAEGKWELCKTEISRSGARRSELEDHLLVQDGRRENTAH